MRGRRGRIAIVGAVIAASSLISLPRGTAEAQPECRADSWTGGTTEMCHGALVYRDYVYDDTGADTQPSSPHGTSLSRATGDVDHTQHGQALNSADLLTLTLTRSGSNATVTFQLNTLFDADRTIAALALDTDDNEGTGGGPWGNGINIASAGHDQVLVFDQRDVAANAINGSFAIPTDAIDANRVWRIQAVIALGDGTVMNVAFRGVRETGNWWEGQQSAALAAGDISAFGTRIAVGDLGSTERHAPAPTEYGLLERVYRSEFSVPRTTNETEGEGVAKPEVPGRAAANAFGQTYAYLGHHQPYAVYVPSPTDEPFGLQLALHGHNAAHASLVNGAGMQHRFGDDLHRIVVVPLGRGPAGGYGDYSERDVLDVMADVQRTYPVDADKVFSGGYSMGGGGAYRMAVLHPDLFAGIVDWVGFTGDCLNGTPLAGGNQRGAGPAGNPVDTTGPFPNDPSDKPGCPTSAIGNMFDYLENLRYLPTAMIYATADELVWVNHAVGLGQRWEQLGYEHILWVHTAEHLTFAVLDDWAKEAAWSAGRTRPETVSHLTFRTNPYMWNPDLGLVADHAWWVADMVPADRGRTDRWAPGTVDMAVDLLSDACPVDTYSTSIERGAGIDPVPWESQEGVPTADVARPRANRISGTLSNVASITIDAAGACLSADEPLSFDVTSDVASTVTVDFGDHTVTFIAE